MNERKKARHREFLNSHIEKLRLQLNESDALAAPVKPDDSIGRLSRVDAMQQQQMQLAIGRQRLEQLDRLESALQLVDQGKYGVCNICGEDIPEARLELVPETHVCAPCLSEIQSR